MAEIVITVTSKIAECLVAPISQGAAYLFCFKQFIGDFEKAKDDLEVKLADVNKLKEEADRKTEEIMPSVRKWLDDVSSILEEVQKLQQELEGGQYKCFNVSRRYSLAKQMESKAKRMMELQQNSHFEPFSQLIQLLGFSDFSSKGFLDFNSRESTYNHLLESITKRKYKMVGLYGMGGSGKTTLAKKVGHRVTELKLFGNFIMAVVSKPPNVVKIQQEIAEQIGLELKEQLPSKRAERLSLGLKNKRILMILDDVWRKISIEEIGIPLNEACCVLITTRLRDVCLSMGCESIIELHLLTEEEAWTLFKMHAYPTNASINEFDGIGRHIVDECKGLPIAIVTIGSTLKGKIIQAWQSTLRRLQHPPPLDIEDDLIAPYTIFEVSFDNLSSPLAKSLFLLCSMFPEDHEIHKEDLIRFCKGALTLEETIVTMEDVRIEILATLEILLNSCLLMHANEKTCVKMHDLVQDAALWIAKKKGQAILVDNHAESKMLASNTLNLKDTKVVSLWNTDENFKLSNQLHCPTLDIMLLQPHGFIGDFTGLKALKVLALITDSFAWRYYWRQRTIDCSISQSIVPLTNLHTLCLRGKKLGDISFLGELKGLEILDLRYSLFHELPVAIVDMEMLKLLDIFGCEIEKKPLKIIEKCEQLEELYFWDSKSIIPEIFSPSKLKRYVICDSKCRTISTDAEGPFVKYLDSCNEAMRALSVQGFRVSALNSSMKDLIRRADILWLENCSWDTKHINLFEIKHLWVLSSQEKRFIIDNLDVNILETQQVFSHLITLGLIEMNSLEQVFQDSSISYSLPMLQELLIVGCPKLRFGIFTHATTMGLPSLGKIEIGYCDKLKWLFSYSLASQCPSLEEISIESCSEFERLLDEEDAHGDTLHHDIQNNPYEALILFPKLKEITIRGCHKVRWLLSYYSASQCPSLEIINMDDCSEFERLVDEEAAYGNAQLHNMQDNPYKALILFPKLKEITIESCHKVRWLLSYSVTSHFPSMEKLRIGLCFELEKLVDGDNDEVAVGDRLPLLKLRDLTLYDLPKLREVFRYEYKMESLHDKQGSPQHKHEDERAREVNSELRSIWFVRLPELEYIWKGPTPIVSLYRLEEVTLWDCQRLRNIFTLATVTSLPELRRFRVVGCDEWEGIFCEESLKNLSASNIVCLPRLEIIRITRCHKVRRIFSYSLASHCPSLKEIYIAECSQLEGVVHAYEGELAAHHEKLFPELKELYLWRLPKLREIYPAYEFTHLYGTMDIKDCPNIYNIPLECKASSDSEIKPES